MKTLLKINFVDFWPGFKKDNNYFYHLLATKYDVVIDEDDPDLLFFSVDFTGARERDKYKNHRCKKIFYTGESISANFDINGSITKSNGFVSYDIGKCDFAFTFDFSQDFRNYRLPLWLMHIDWFNKGDYGGNPDLLFRLDSIEDNKYKRRHKKDFCAFIFSNPIPMRIKAFNKFSEYKPVHGYGKPFNNWSRGEIKKYEILSNYKFSICFENRSYPGYHTEKPFHAKVAGTIPIYFSDRSISNDMNEKAFIHYGDFDSMDSLLNYVKKVDQDDELYNKYFNEPLLKNNTIREEFKPSKVLDFFENIILK